MRRLLLIVVTVSVLSAGVTGLVTGRIVKAGIDKSSAQQAQRLFHAQQAGCGRNNIRQAAANKNSQAEYRFNSLFASALTQQPRRHQSAKRRQLTKHFQKLLLGLVASLTWTPLNHHCTKHPTAVQLPVAFALRKPTRADLPQ